MEKIANKQMICKVLMDAAKTDKSIVALYSDSRGSGSFTPFAETYPDQFVETGIAEQNLVSISACSRRYFYGMCSRRYFYGINCRRVDDMLRWQIREQHFFLMTA